MILPESALGASPYDAATASPTLAPEPAAAPLPTTCPPATGILHCTSIMLAIFPSAQVPLRCEHPAEVSLGPGHPSHTCLLAVMARMSPAQIEAAVQYCAHAQGRPAEELRPGLSRQEYFPIHVSHFSHVVSITHLSP